MEQLFCRSAFANGSAVWVLKLRLPVGHVDGLIFFKLYVKGRPLIFPWVLNDQLESWIHSKVIQLTPSATRWARVQTGLFK